jgi:beta-glucosidase
VEQPQEKPTGFRAVSFPADFRFGTAVAGWQVEGDEGAAGPVDSNWSRWMAMGKARGNQTNPDGNGFFTDYEAEIARAQALGIDTFRLSLDWSRVEPTPGAFDEAELAHFDDVLDAVTAAGLEPVLTLYHWTVPPWVQNPDADAPGGKVDLIADKSREVVDAWEAFVRAVIPRVKDRVDTYTVLNEPLTMVVVGYIDGRFPPGQFFNIPLATDFGINLAFMHARAFDVIKELDDVDADGDGKDSFVGLTMTVYNDWFIQAVTTGDLDVNLNGQIDEDFPTEPPEGHYPELANRLEFIGVQYYGPVKVKESALLNEVGPLYGLPLTDVHAYSDPAKRLLPANAMGREISAAGFADTLDRYGKWGLPLIITENGTTSNTRADYPEIGDEPEEPPPIPAVAFDDAQAAMYLVTHLWEVGRALDRGVDIRGYYHWTLSDNFEWVDGQMQRFGAYHVDFEDPAYPRTLAPIGEAYRDIISARGIDEALWNSWVLERFPSDGTEAGQGPTTRDNVIGTLD